MPTITILIKQNDERVICSFSCSNDINLNKNIVGKGYMGVSQNYTDLSAKQLLHNYVEKHKTTNGFTPNHPYNQYGFLFDDRYEVHNGSHCFKEYGHYGNNDLLVIGNRVKSKELLLKLFNDLNNSTGSLSHRITDSLSKNKVVGFDSKCEMFGLSSSAISFMKYDNEGNNIHTEYYLGKDIDPIDYLCGKL